MAGNEPNDGMIKIEKIYTFSEAIQLIKQLDKQPTVNQVRWYNVRTGQEVLISNNSR